MYIDEKTAQLILDAIAWCNRDWQDAIDWKTNADEMISMAREDFIRFCKDRGIDGVERKVIL